MHEEGPRVQVRLCVEEETQGLGQVTSTWLDSTQGLLQEQHGREMVNAMGTARTLHCTCQEDSSQSQRLKPGVPRGWPCHRCRWVSQATFPQQVEQAAPAVIHSWAQLDTDRGTEGSEMGCLGALVLPQPSRAKQGARDTQPSTGSDPDLSYLLAALSTSSSLHRWQCPALQEASHHAFCRVLEMGNLISTKRPRSTKTPAPLGAP